MKGHLVRLGPAVEQALRAKALRDKARRATAERQRLVETHAAILNALPAHIALLDENGGIVAVNEAWRRFADVNGGRPERDGVGSNYLDVCDRAAGDSSAGARAVADGIRAVLRGDLPEFFHEYPCHSPGEQRWFRLIVTPLQEAMPRGAVVTHINITDRKRAEDALQAHHEEYERHHAALLELARSPALQSEVDATALPKITSTLATAMKVARVGFWSFTADRSAIVCRDLCNVPAAGHSAGQTLRAADFPRYFQALNTTDVIAANDARNDVRTSEFAATYLEAEGITSMLDVPVLIGGCLEGVLCVEQVGPARVWTASECNLAMAVASQISQVLTRAAHARSEARHRLLFLSNPIPGWVYDVETLRFLAVNDAAVAKYGYTREEFLALTVKDIRPVEDIPALLKDVARVTEGFTGAGIWRHRLKDGRIIEVEITGHVLEFDGRRSELILANDVTERLRAEEDKREALERFRLLAKATNDAIRDWDLTTGVLWWNEGFETLFGFSRTGVESTIDSWSSRVHPADREAIFADVQRAIESGAASWSGEYRFRRRDGSYAFVLDRGHILRDASGKGRRLIGGMTDLTERRKTEERLREQASLLDAAQDAIFVRDLDHRLIYCNQSAERLYGWSAAELIGRSFRELICADRSQFDAAVQQLFAHGKWSGQLVQKKRDGGTFEVEGRWTLMRDANDQPKSVLVVNTDITERKKLELQFLRAQRMESIGTLAGGIAHDLNNLLAPITMGVQLLRHLDPRSEVKPVIENIERAAHRGANLVKQVLSFARGVEGARVAVQIRHIVREVVSILENTFPKNIRVETSLPNGLWLVRGDPTQLNQTLLNLCVNARDAMPQGGALTLAAENVDIDAQYAVMNRDVGPGRYVMLSVADTGTGMPREILDRIFDPFFTTKAVGQGTGLGLATVLGIVRSHGGFVNVYSELGRGSTFKVYLPAQDGGDETAEAGLASREKLPRGRGELILVVDDETSILEITKQTLEAFGYRVITAEDGAQAVGQFALARDQVRVVLTDMMMPVMDGPALISALHHIDPRVRIIAASGLDANENVARAASLGVKHFLPKPYSASTLLDALHRVLAEPGAT